MATKKKTSGETISGMKGGRGGNRAQSSRSSSFGIELRSISIPSPGPRIGIPDYENAGSNRTLQILLRSELLESKPILYESIVFENALSKGAWGEVWICEDNEQKVAVKRLLFRKKHNAESVQEFAEGIELSASLIHPNVVEFIGVAWNSLNSLMMVLEYLPMGNLKDYLDKKASKLSWARDKIYVAIGIARALEYLHTRTPLLIRDLKLSNILLTDTLEPKIIDFGVSRGLVDLTMTGGVGSPYWTAPEVLEGKHYTEKADIHSFGVVLSELDTGKSPYFDAVMKDGTKLKPFQILKEVKSGTLRPSFSEECPPRILGIGVACLSLDPSNRPTAQELVKQVEGRDCDSDSVSLL